MALTWRDLASFGSGILVFTCLGAVGVFVVASLVVNCWPLREDGIKRTMYGVSTRPDLQNNLWVDVSAVTGHVLELFLDANGDGQAETRVLFMAGRPFACTEDLDEDGYHDVMVDLRGRQIQRIPLHWDRGPFCAADLNTHVRQSE